MPPTDLELRTEEPKSSRERANIENLDRSARYDNLAFQAIQNAISVANRVANDGATVSNLVNNNAASLSNRTNQNRETFDTNEFYDQKRDEDYGDERMSRSLSQAVTTEAIADDLLLRALEQTTPGSADEQTLVGAIRLCRKHRKAA